MSIMIVSFYGVLVKILWCNMFDVEEILCLEYYFVVSKKVVFL